VARLDAAIFTSWVQVVMFTVGRNVLNWWIE